MENQINLEEKEIPEGIEKTHQSEQEILELILKFLYENNYTESAKLLESKTNIKYHQNEMQQLITMLLSKNYTNAISYLNEQKNLNQAQKDEALKLIHFRNYFEILRKNLKENTKNDALNYLRNDLSKLIPCDILNKFSLLLFIKDSEVLEENLKQNFEEVVNDEIFLSKIQSLVCLYTNSEGNEILKDVQLETILKKYTEIKQANMLNNDSNNDFKQIFLIENFTPSKKDKKDEIWMIRFTKSFKNFAICLRNGTLSIFSDSFTRTAEKKILKLDCVSSFKAHEQYISYISWSNDERFLLSCANDKLIRLWNPFEAKLIKQFSIHSAAVSCALFFLSNEKIISSSIDKRLVVLNAETGDVIESENFFRIRQILICDAFKYVIIIPASLNDIIFYDYVNNNTVGSIEEPDPIISANISQHDKGKFLIVNVSKVNANINLYSVQTKELISKYYGHRQEEYVINCSFGGKNDEYIICGSENNSVLIWHRSSSIPIKEIEGHTGVVNDCALGFFDGVPLVFSVSDDFTLRIWSKEENVSVEYENLAKVQEASLQNIERSVEESESASEMNFFTDEEDSGFILGPEIIPTS